MEMPLIRRRRALSSQDARDVRQRGHDDAKAFAKAIGLPRDYHNDPHQKKDVIDLSGDPHSVKSGQKKWQIFLYGLGRFQSDDAFRTMNGIGDILVECINSFQPSYDEYQKNKVDAKERLRDPMRRLASKLQDKARLRTFLNKSLFDGGEGYYLTIKHDGHFHVFWGKEVVKVLSDNLEVCNSRAISAGQFPEQKVLFRYEGKNLGELEMRNDSRTHYREIRFNMLKPRVMALLFSKIVQVTGHNALVSSHGKATRRFWRW